MAATASLRLEALDAVHAAAMDGFANHMTPGAAPLQCCVTPGPVTYVEAFRTEVNEEDQCFRYVNGVQDLTLTNVIEQITPTFRSNFDAEPNLKWQYFGAQTNGVYGVFACLGCCCCRCHCRCFCCRLRLLLRPHRFPAGIYPATGDADCNDYDPRFRPVRPSVSLFLFCGAHAFSAGLTSTRPPCCQWYVLAATPKAKDVVLVIDSSGSMGSTNSGSTLMDIAIDAAKVVLATLSPNDRVGVVDFDSAARYPSVLNCGGTVAKLSSATPDAISQLNDLVDQIRAGGFTRYISGLRIAFDMFDNTGDIGNDRVILFLSDGIPTEGANEITTYLDNRRATDSNFHLLTYGFAFDLQECVLAWLAIPPSCFTPACVCACVSPALPAAPSLKTWRTKTTASSNKSPVPTRRNCAMSWGSTTPSLPTLRP